MTYADAIQFLHSLGLFGARLGLENTFRLAAQVGNPQQKLRFIHVAGTNGKGSTCAMLESIYRAAGLRVGLFTSPHLVGFAERIQVNRNLIAEPDIARLVSELRSQTAAGAPPHPPASTAGPGTTPRNRPEACPSFFEFITVMALLHFAEQNCDLVLWETGLGGRLDATNIVTPLASIITNIGIEHSQWLGDTIEKIAAEKAGIIKPGIPVITASRPREGLEVIAAAAREKGAPLIQVTPAAADQPPLDHIELPLHGPHQKMNAAAAIAAVRALAAEIPVSDTELCRGLASVYWPGRLQRVRTALGQTVVLDGAHNPAGAEALRVAFRAEFPGSRPALIFGVFRDKDSASMCRSLAPLARHIVLTKVPADRTEDPATLAPVCRKANPNAAIEVCSSLRDALDKTASDPFVVVAGSLYLVGEAMELLHLEAAPTGDEKLLNEWNLTR